MTFNNKSYSVPSQAARWPNVSYGVRGVGEVPIVPPAAAVANAIARATGARITRMPMTPERVLAALESARADQDPI